MEHHSRHLPKRKALQHVFQSIRFRLSVLFVVAFVTISGLSAWQLQAKMAPAFLRMEHDGAIKSAERVIGVMDAQLTSLNTLNRDWAVWDDMHEFILRPTPAFKASNMSDESLKNSGLSAIFILSATGSPVHLQTRPMSDGLTLTQADFEAIRPVFISLLDVGKSAGRCGYIKPRAAVLLLCANPVSRSDGTDGHIGAVVMVRELSPALLKEVANQSKENVFLTAPNRSAAENDRWPLPGFVHLPATQAAVSLSDITLTLDINIPGLNGQPLMGIRVPLDRSLVAQGQLAINQMTSQLGITVFATCILLLLVVHYGFVLPLGRLRRSIRTIHENKQWQSAVDDTRSDEIGVLAHEVNGLLGVIRTQVEALMSLSMTDALTGLPNRRRFDQRLEEEINRMQRKPQALSLLMIDIDYFKQFNDHYGHPAGDVALKQVAQVLRENTRKNDLPARMGGEEFAVMLIDTPADAALLFAQKLVLAITDAQIAHAKSQVGPVLSISIGVAQYQRDQDTPAQFVEHADMALYAAKGAGRNRAMTYTPA